MMKSTVYVETTIVSYLVAAPAPAVHDEIERVVRGQHGQLHGIVRRHDDGQLLLESGDGMWQRVTPVL